MSELREALQKIAGKRTTGEPLLAGMPAANQRTLGTLTREHIRQHVRGYHDAGADYLKAEREKLEAVRKGAQKPATPEPDDPYAADYKEDRLEGAQEAIKKFGAGWDDTLKDLR